MSEEVVVEVTLGDHKTQAIEKSEDIFEKPFDELRKLVGVQRKHVRNFERRVAKGYEGINGAHSKQIETESFLGYDWLDCIIPPTNLEDLSKLFDISPAHHAAVNAKVESVYGLGYEWRETAKAKAIKPRTEAGLKRKDAWLEKTKYELEEWLDSLNKIDVFDQIMKKIGVDYETMGNAYLEIGRDNKGKIGYIGHVPAAKVRVRRPRDGFVFIFSNEIQYFRNFGANNPNPLTNDANPNELIHFKKYTPSHTYYGLPDIISAKSALAGNEFASRYNLDYFENKAIPRHVIISKGAEIGVKSVSRLIEFFESGLKGQHHRSMYVPLPDKDSEIEFHSIEAGQQDFSFGEYRNANNEEIFMAHRIPASRAGVFTANISLAASRDADKVFKESYSRPEQSIFEKKIARVFREKTDAFEFKLNELSLTDADTQSKIDERDVRMGIVVPDEVRGKRAIGPRPDGKGMKPYEAKPQEAAEQKAQATKSRTRDADRSAGATDSAGEARNEKGAGRTTS